MFTEDSSCLVAKGYLKFGSGNVVIVDERRLYTGQSCVGGWRPAIERSILFSFETVFTGKDKPYLALQPRGFNPR